MVRALARVGKKPGHLVRKRTKPLIRGTQPSYFLPVFYAWNRLSKIRHLFLREADELERRALDTNDEAAQAELMDRTVHLRILAEMQRYNGNLH